MGRHSVIAAVIVLSICGTALGFQNITFCQALPHNSVKISYRDHAPSGFIYSPQYLTNFTVDSMDRGCYVSIAHLPRRSYIFLKAILVDADRDEPCMSRERYWMLQNGSQFLFDTNICTRENNETQVITSHGIYSRRELSFLIVDTMPPEKFIISYSVLPIHDFMSYTRRKLNVSIKSSGYIASNWTRIPETGSMNSKIILTNIPSSSVVRIDFVYFELGNSRTCDSELRSGEIGNYFIIKGLQNRSAPEYVCGNINSAPEHFPMNLTSRDGRLEFLFKASYEILRNYSGFLFKYRVMENESELDESTTSSQSNASSTTRDSSSTQRQTVSTSTGPKLSTVNAESQTLSTKYTSETYLNASSYNSTSLSDEPTSTFNNTSATDSPILTRTNSLDIIGNVQNQSTTDLTPFSTRKIISENNFTTAVDELSAASVMSQMHIIAIAVSGGGVILVVILITLLCKVTKKSDKSMEPPNPLYGKAPRRDDDNHNCESVNMNTNPAYSKVAHERQCASAQSNGRCIRSHYHTLEEPSRRGAHLEPPCNCAVSLTDNTHHYSEIDSQLQVIKEEEVTYSHSPGEQLPPPEWRERFDKSNKIIMPSRPGDNFYMAVLLDAEGTSDPVVPDRDSCLYESCN